MTGSTSLEGRRPQHLGYILRGPRAARAPQDDGTGHRSRDAVASEFCLPPRRKTKIMRKNEGVERRKTHPAMAVPCEGAAARRPLFPPRFAGEGREGARSPSGAPRRRLSQRANARTQSRPRFTRNKRDTQALPAPSFALKRSTPRPGHTAGGDDARTARERGYKSRPQEPHSLHVPGVSRGHAPHERDSQTVTEIETKVKGCPGRKDARGVQKI